MTVGETVFKIAHIIDTAVRRVGKSADEQTPEIVEIAKNNLYLVLNNLSNVGLNLWCIEELYISLIQGKAKYTLSKGTVDILNTNYRRLVKVTGVQIISATEHVTEFTDSTNIQMIYLDVEEPTVTVSFSEDGVTYSDSITLTTDEPKWFAIDGIVSKSYAKITNSTALTVNSVQYVSSFTDTPMYRFNRDEYSWLPNKNNIGIPLQYLFDKQISPTVTLWPVPNIEATNNIIQLYRNRHVGDVGQLTETIDVPQRWLEAITWQLAANLAFELPAIAPERIALCSSKAQSALNEVYLEERDNSSVNIAPDIGVYTS